MFKTIWKEGFQNDTTCARGGSIKCLENILEATKDEFAFLSKSRVIFVLIPDNKRNVRSIYSDAVSGSCRGSKNI